MAKKQSLEPEIPALTEMMAMLYAKLLHAGCPPALGVQYLLQFDPADYTPAQISERCGQIAARWRLDPVLIEASHSLIGGVWFELPLKRRQELARDKMNAEVALWVWQNSWVTASGKDDMEKMRQAREMLNQELGKAVATDDPLTAFARFATDLMAQRQADESVEKAARRKSGMTEHVMITPGLDKPGRRSH